MSSTVGFGIDELDLETPRHYPMAYAFYARGFAAKRDLSRLDGALERLLLLQLAPGAWGLPLSWYGRVDEPYLITTVFALHALLDGYESTGNECYLSAVEDGVKWVVRRLGKHPCGCFKYSPRVNLVIFNPHIEFIGFLHRYLEHEDNPKLREVADEGLSYALWQRRVGNRLIPYGRHSMRRFDFHTSYAFEGLHYSHVDIRDGWRLLMSLLMRGDGFMRKELVKGLESRAWGYATHLYVGAMIGDTKYTPRILRYVRENLFSPSGEVYYRSDDHRVFVRHQAHMFYAMSLLGEEL